MNEFDLMRTAKCPNKCGDLTVLKKPINTFQVLPMELIDIIIEYQEHNPDEAKELEQIITQTNIVSLCMECGFILQSTGSPSSGESKT